jgi:CRISPR-associated endonuclease Cas1
MRDDLTALFRSLSPKAGVCVADGYGIRIFVRRGHLFVEDGIGRHRRQRVFSRANAGIKRVVVHGHEGFVTLEAIRWMSDLGIAFLHIDRDATVLAASAPHGNDDARLRRKQAAAVDTNVGLEISRWLLDLKLRGQERVLTQLDAKAARAAIREARRSLNRLDSVADLVSTPEARAAAAYWDAWAHVPIKFVGRDEPRVPEQWRRFGTRRSPLSGSPRLAANPANAILNYLYRLLEAETRFACLIVGLDPGLGFFHRDKRGRDNLVVDVMEACRPDIDAYALRMFGVRVFRAADFQETRKGVCRVLRPLSHELTETSLRWSEVVAPIVESLARRLGKASRVRQERTPTPLTGRNRWRRQELEGTSAGTAAVTPKPKECRECGRRVEIARRRYCDECLATGSRNSGSLAKAAATVRNQNARAKWRADGLPPGDPATYRAEILPLLKNLPLAAIAEATSLSIPYCSQIRRGTIPHVRHWRALSRLARGAIRS